MTCTPSLPKSPPASPSAAPTRRAAYLERIRAAAARRPGPRRARAAPTSRTASPRAAPTRSCTCAPRERPNVAIVSAYNDMLSAHQPFERYPAILKQAVREAGGVAQFAGGVPAMCDGITQGRAGMELSLFSRDVVAHGDGGRAVARHVRRRADARRVRQDRARAADRRAVASATCRASSCPPGRCPRGLPNDEKSRIRQLHAEGKVGRDELLEAESQSYHSPGTCTFYGTANSNQLVVEAMGLHLPGAALRQPGHAAARALTEDAARAAGDRRRCAPIGEIVDERAIVNGVVALLATGGSTNHTMHLVAVAAAAGIALTWDDFADLSRAVPLLARVYPNGPADINHFHAAGGIAVPDRRAARRRPACTPTSTPSRAGGLGRYREEPYLDDDGVALARRAGATSGDATSCAAPASRSRRRRHPRARRRARPGGDEGLAPSRPSTASSTAPARVFDDQADFLAAFRPRRARRRPRGGRPPPGPAGERHAGAAQAHAGARRADGPRPPRRAGHRRPHVRRLGQGARGDARARPRRRPAARSRACATATSCGSTPSAGPPRRRRRPRRPREPERAPSPARLGTGRELFATFRDARRAARRRRVGVRAPGQAVTGMTPRRRDRGGLGAGDPRRRHRRPRRRRAAGRGARGGGLPRSR